MASFNDNDRLVRMYGLLLLGCVAFCGGCSAFTFSIDATPSDELSSAYFAKSKRNMVPIDVSLLSQPRPDAYRIDEGDILGLVIDGVLPFYAKGEPPEIPPVHFREGGQDLAPALGVPVMVQEGGIVTLPVIGRVNLAGLSMLEAADLLKQRYEEEEVLSDNATQPIVTLIHARQTSVMVIREDTGESSERVNFEDSHGGIYQLPAYKNDVLNALLVSGGLPGLQAKNEVRIYRRPSVDQYRPGYMIDSDMFPPNAQLELSYDEKLTRPARTIPLRVERGTEVMISPQDVILDDGDIVYIANRDTEVFYTAGMLPGGEHLLPRDYDVDIFEAMAIAGYSYGNSSGGGGIGPGATGVIPTELFIFRECEDGREYSIRIDLEQAIKCDRDRLLVQSGDKLLLRYSCCEEALNFGIFSFFTYGIQQLMRQ
ncbi:polysaccharide biosynthesis/export family protein [Rhodopirellula sp. SWK7]|uniref:polysaccharide biosynthesis/export family protein n=1 Tax=Rhodopirellula sp. SWK7 TaxID=595460 RepID=UPI0003461B24|nr:polysaccharide biosynthesis/export family protein [Rhodopirellula sp. SWK7]